MYAPLRTALIVALAVLVIGCHNGSSGGKKKSGGSTVAAVHEFEFDTDTGLYTVEGVELTQADIDRDLAGQVCASCHLDSVAEVKDSVHFRLTGRTDRVMFPGGGAHGMLDRACGLPATTGLTNSFSDVNLGECAKCHVGRYLPMMEGMFGGMFAQMGVPDAQAQATRIIEGGIDCLVCHAEQYRSYPEGGTLAVLAPSAPADGASPTPTGSARVARDNTDFDRDGAPDALIDMDGDGALDTPLMMDTDGNGMPDTPWPTVAQDRSRTALASIGHTTEEACLRCHDHARTGYKRGTLFAEGHDVHATVSTGVFEGAENQCTVCHTPSEHKFVRGHWVGGDLAAADYPPPPAGTAQDPLDPTDVNCLQCHDPAALPNTLIHSSEHVAAMSCQTCHIPYGSGITYSAFGQGGHLAFSRAGSGKDTKLVSVDMYVAEGEADLDADFEAYKVRPTLMWFDGGTSFLAQPLSARGMPNAKITPFKPMANGMVFDARYFDGVQATNAAGASYNAHSMYRFFAEGNNAEAFAGLDMLDMTPDAVRNVTLADFQSPDPDAQTMALMQVFPNLVYFDKADFGYEHYLTATGSEHDLDGDGLLDVGADYLFDMLGAANAGLAQFAGFNAPMGLPPTYQWYPPYEEVDDVITMKLPDGSLMKMFLQMQAMQLPPDQQAAFLAAVADYPSFSYVTLGGHGVAPATEALGATSCLECHGPDGVLAQPIPVGTKQPTDVPGMGTLELPVYRWTFYNLRGLTDLGLSVTSEEILAGTADVDVDGDTLYVRESDTSFVVNWFAPDAEGGYRPADDPTALIGSELTAGDLTWNGGAWMPVLEPVVELIPNYAVLGYEAAEILW